MRLWHDAPSAILATPLLHAIAAFLAGNVAMARASLVLVGQAKRDNDIAYYDVLYFFTYFLVYGSLDDLRMAHTEIQRQAALVHNARLQADFLQQVRLNRMVEMLWRVRPLAPTIRSAAGLWVQFTQLYRSGKGQRVAAKSPDEPTQRVNVSLAWGDAPLGRKLTEADYTKVGLSRRRRTSKSPGPTNAAAMCCAACWMRLRRREPLPPMMTW